MTNALEMLLPLPSCLWCWAVLTSHSTPGTCTPVLLLCRHLRKAVGFSSKLDGLLQETWSIWNSLFSAMDCFSFCWNKNDALSLQGCRRRRELFRSKSSIFEPLRNTVFRERKGNRGKNIGDKALIVCWRREPELRKHAGVEEGRCFSIQWGACFRGEANAFQLGLAGLSRVNGWEKISV